MRERIPLGQVLLEEGYIDEFQFKAALGRQRRYGGRLASQVYTLGFVPEQVLVTLLSRQLGYPGVVLRRSVLRVSNADVLPRDTAVRYLALPALVQRDRVVLVMSNPSDMKVLDELRFIVGKRIEAYLALSTVLEEMLQRLYDARAIGQAQLLYGEEANPLISSEDGHLEMVTPETPLEPPRHGTSEIAVDEDAFHETTLVGPPRPTIEPGFVPSTEHVGRPNTGVGPPPQQQGAPRQPISITELQAESTADPQPPPPSHERTTSESGFWSTPAPPPTVAARSGEPPTILLADDDGDVVTEVMQALDQRGFTAVAGADGIAALQNLRNHPPDAVILELDLSGAHGFEICRRMRSSQRFALTPIIVLTAQHRGDGYRRDITALFGVDVVMEKPFQVDLLVRRLEELLARVGRIEPRTDAAQQLAKQFYQSAGALIATGELEQAIDLLREGLQHDPYSELLHFQLGNACRRKSLDLHAIEEFERAVELRSDFFPALRALAGLYQEHGFRHRSFELWERAMEACPEEELRRKIREHLAAYFAVNE